MISFTQRRKGRQEARLKSRLHAKAFATAMALGFLLFGGTLSALDSPGLVVRATDGTRTVRFVTATSNFYVAEGESIHPSLGPSFRADWTGSLMILRAGEYEFDPAITID